MFCVRDFCEGEFEFRSIENEASTARLATLLGHCAKWLRKASTSRHLQIEGSTRLGSQQDHDGGIEESCAIGKPLARQRHALHSSPSGHGLINVNLVRGAMMDPVLFP
jgi:hypothetical protein